MSSQHQFLAGLTVLALSLTVHASEGEVASVPSRNAHHAPAADAAKPAELDALQLMIVLHQNGAQNLTLRVARPPADRPCCQSLPAVE